MIIYRNSNRSVSRINLRQVLDTIFIYAVSFETMERADKDRGELRYKLDSYYTDVINDLRTNSTRTDLGVLVNIFTDTSKFEKMKNYRENINLAMMVGKFIPVLIEYLRNLKGGNANFNRSEHLLKTLERLLVIQKIDYKDLRIMACGWDEMNTYQKQIHCTRLYQAIKYRSRESGVMDIDELFRVWHKERNLATRAVFNAETNQPINPLTNIGRGALSAILSAVAGFAVGYNSGKK